MSTQPVQPKSSHPQGESAASSAAPVAPTVQSAQIHAIVNAYHGAPHQVLGPHEVTVAGARAVAVRAFRPLDDQVLVQFDEGAPRPMQRIDEAGFFELVLDANAPDLPATVAQTLADGASAPLPAYRLIAVDDQGQRHELEDPYRFPPLLTDFDLHLFSEGSFLYAYDKLGAQIRTIDGVTGVNFAVWAPNAERVSVIGTFNGWDNRAHPMQRHTNVGIWELFVPNLPVGTHYKFAIKSRFLGYEVDKSDPYGFWSEMRPSTDSRVWDLDAFEWHDAEWMEKRAAHQALDRPISVYEVHLGSWRRVPEDNGFLNYRDLAHQLVAYAQELGYTHLELLPITEHPFDGSWGYQTTGYFAPSSRFGSPADFQYFVDYCHQHDIGVFLDWVPAHFPRDAHGLAFFDGTHLYEHSDPRQGEHVEWGTKIFNYGRNEVRNFLLSNAIFWLKEYHLDGLRVDAVASMLYLDYSRENQEWIPNRFGGRENLEAVDFIRRFNEVTHAEMPGILTMAEESTSWPMVTKPTYMGGLGFDLKWNMGWMHDMLAYMQRDPIYRRYHQNEITFSLVYAFSENYILPFSHDEVVHLKRSMLDKMPGDAWQKYANLRALYAYMFAHPGKKLLFMGSEFGQWTEWNEARSLDWHLTEFDDHRRLQHYLATLNRVYRDNPALYSVDGSWEGFQWIDFSDADQSIISFIRRSDRELNQPGHELVVVCNFTPQPHLGYRIGLPAPGTYVEVLNTDAPEFGGSGVSSPPVTAEPQPWQHCDYSAPVNLPPLGVIYLQRQTD